MRRAGGILAVLVLLVASGCAPQIDVAAEEAAIRDAGDVGMLNAAKAKDVEGILSFYIDNASMLPPNAPIATGKEALRAIWTDLFANPSVTWRTTGVKVSQAGDLGYAMGTYEITMDDAEGEAATEIGKWVVVWEKQADGSWKQRVGIWNSDQPSPGSATE